MVIHDGHDGICWECGAVLSPVAAVAHFGYEVLDASPQQRIATARSWMVFQRPRPFGLVAREMWDRGLSTKSDPSPGCLVVHPDPLERLGALSDALAWCARWLDRRISSFIRWVSAPPARRPVRKARNLRKGRQ